MKNTFQINIGLTTASNSPVKIHRLLQDLRAAGLYAVNSRIALGYWKGHAECTLAAECLFAIPLCHPEARLAIRVSLARIAETHGQECVAVLWTDSTGELIPDVGTFDDNQFRPVYPPEETPAPVPACETDPGNDPLFLVADALECMAEISERNGDNPDGKPEQTRSNKNMKTKKKIEKLAAKIFVHYCLNKQFSKEQATRYALDAANAFYVEISKS